MGRQQTKQEVRSRCDGWQGLGLGWRSGETTITNAKGDSPAGSCISRSQARKYTAEHPYEVSVASERGETQAAARSLQGEETEGKEERPARGDFFFKEAAATCFHAALKDR